jgi:hypothetical protein
MGFRSRRRRTSHPRDGARNTKKNTLKRTTSSSRARGAREWLTPLYTAAHSFQQAIDAAVGNMTATDMVLCIVWKRALKLNPSMANS